MIKFCGKIYKATMLVGHTAIDTGIMGYFHAISLFRVFTIFTHSNKSCDIAIVADTIAQDTFPSYCAKKIRTPANNRLINEIQNSFLGKTAMVKLCKICSTQKKRSK